MPLRFANPRIPPRIDGLALHHHAQVAAAGSICDGRALSAEVRLGNGRDAWFQPELWDAVDESGQACFEIWIYGVDNGAVFRAGTTELIGPIVQFGFTSDIDRASWTLLAQASIPEAASGSALSRISFTLDDV